MNNVVSFKTRKPGRSTKVPAKVVGNVISLADWCRAARPHRTPTGVFFITHAFGGPTLAT